MTEHQHHHDCLNVVEAVSELLSSNFPLWWKGFHQMGSKCDRFTQKDVIDFSGVHVWSSLFSCLLWQFLLKHDMMHI